MNKDTKDKLEVLKLVSDLAERESDRSWVRYSMMLYANTGILAILTYALQSQRWINVALPSFMGVIMSYAWLKTNGASYYYEHRWHADMEAIIKSDKTLRTWVKGRNSPRIAKPFRNRSGMFYFNIVPTCFLLFWLTVLTVSMLTIMFGPFWEHNIKFQL